MTFAEKQERRQALKQLEAKNNCGRDILKRLVNSVILYELQTTIFSIILGWIPVDMLFFFISTRILFCFLLHMLLLAVTNSLLTQSISEDIASFYNYDTTEKERTKLLKQVMRLPQLVAAEEFIIFMGCEAIWLTFVINTNRLDMDSIVLICVIEVCYGYYSMLHSFTGISQVKCTVHASAIVEKGVSKQEIEARHTFGTRSTLITVLHIFIPIVLIGLSFFMFAWRAYVSNMSPGIMIMRGCVIGGMQALAYFISSILLFNRMIRSINNMRDSLSGMNKENLHKVKFEKTDLSNEFMYNLYLVNTIVAILQKILKQSLEISMTVIESSNELSIISKETAVTSLQQNSGIKELLSVMEESDALSKNIADKISEVSVVAKKTTDNIIDGFDILKQNMNKFDEIKAANDITVEGIKQLTEKMTGISDITRIINSIADQTNIIAFNAELEASSAGNVGENFSLVANEIRRLTNNTIQSTNEIRKRLTDIQQTSTVLLLSSQNGSSKIYDGIQIINELNKRFEELKHSSETMDYASEDIKQIIEQQTASFAQIVVTLRQIAATTENFSNSTQTISDSAQNLCTISERLKKLQPAETIPSEVE